MANVLVTGGAGFIGANFVLGYAARHPDDQIIVLDSLTYAGNEKNLESLSERKNFYFVHGDICDERLVTDLMREREIDTIVHFAAESHVDRSITGPDEFIRTNVIGTHTLLKAAKALWLDEWQTNICRFHHVSTDEVYGTLTDDDPAFSETTAYAPNSPYSASKAASDHLVRAYHETYGLPVTVSNCSNNYGPLQFPEKLIPVVILNAVAGRPIPVYGDGMNIRDWLYVDDHCAAIELILECGRAGETYNVGGDCELTNLDLVRRICAMVDELRGTEPGTSEALITYVDDRPGHDRRYAINFAKLRDELGWEPAHNIEQGLRETVAWYLHNQAWCDNCGAQQIASERRGLSVTK